MKQDERSVDPASRTWAQHMASRVGGAVRARRTQLKMSAQNLSDACQQVGYAVPRNTIANLENGRKGEVSLAEITTLAAALRVPPVQLIFPDLPEGQCEYLPGTSTTSWDALKWFTGETTFRDRLPDRNAPEFHLALMRELDSTVGEYLDLLERQADARRQIAELDARYEKLAADSARDGIDNPLDEEDYRRNRVEFERRSQGVDAQIARLKKNEQLTKQTLKSAGFVVEVGDNE